MPMIRPRLSAARPDRRLMSKSFAGDVRPDSRVLHRHAHSHLPVAVAGDSAYVIDSTGKRYLDACGGVLPWS